MGRPKGSGKKTVQEPIEPVYGNEKKEVTVTPAAHQEVPEIAPQKACISERIQFLYHLDHAPKIFMKGDVIPAGWVGPKGIVGVRWTINPETGMWSKKT